MHIVIQNGLKYNAYDSGYSNKQENKIKGKRGGGEKKKKKKKRKKGGGENKNHT